MGVFDLIIQFSTAKVFLGLNGAALLMLLTFAYALWWFKNNG